MTNEDEQPKLEPRLLPGDFKFYSKMAPAPSFPFGNRPTRVVKDVRLHIRRHYRLDFNDCHLYFSRIQKIQGSNLVKNLTIHSISRRSGGGQCQQRLEICIGQ